MEKSGKLKSKILKILLYKRLENTYSFKSHAGKRFSGPLLPTKDESFRANEPTSPKVSCFGQIKCKSKIKREQKSSNKLHREKKNTKKSSSIKKFFSAKPKRASSFNDASCGDQKMGLPHGAPALRQMKRYASGRDPLINFDWRAQVAPIDANHWNNFSDEEKGVSDHEEEEEVIVPFSAPILIGDSNGGVTLQPRKEVNLWKRRTMAPLRALQVDIP